MYNMVQYSNNKYPCLFFGVYYPQELQVILNHKGPKFVMFGGTDCDDRFNIHRNILNKLKDFKVMSFLKNDNFKKIFSSSVYDVFEKN